MLLTFFLPAAALSKLGAAENSAAVDAVVEKREARDAFQVLANGGVFAGAALLHLISAVPAWTAVGVGALAASASDTWATELGTRFGRQPRSIVSGRPVAAGTSGGITIAGWVAAVLGAILMALAAALAGFAVPIHAVIAGGVAGAFADSLIGATIQERRWCDVCNSGTERSVHDCGNATRHCGGIARFDNDIVNLAGSCVGALVALVLS